MWFSTRFSSLLFEKCFLTKFLRFKIRVFFCVEYHVVLYVWNCKFVDGIKWNFSVKFVWNMIFCAWKLNFPSFSIIIDLKWAGNNMQINQSQNHLNFQHFTGLKYVFFKIYFDFPVVSIVFPHKQFHKYWNIFSWVFISKNLNRHRMSVNSVAVATINKIIFFNIFPNQWFCYFISYRLCFIIVSRFWRVKKAQHSIREK